MNLTTIRIEHTDCYWENLFTAEELESIDEYCQTFEVEIATAGNQPYVSDSLYKIRKSHVAWIPRNDDSNWFFSKIEAAVNKINSKYYSFDIYPLEMIQYTIYDEEGSHYDWHWDIFVGNELDNLKAQSQRKMSAILQLVEPSEYDGGVLEIAPSGVIKEIPRQQGYMSIFPAFVPHRVTPVTSGLRKTLVAWFVGPDWR